MQVLKSNSTKENVLIALKYYSLVLKNYSLKNWGLILVFSSLVLLILFAAGHTLAERSSDRPLPLKLYVSGAWVSSYLLSYYVFPEINKDFNFLQNHFSLTELRWIQACKGLILCFFLFIVFSIGLTSFGLMPWQEVFVGLPFVVFSLLFAFFPKANQGKAAQALFQPKRSSLLKASTRGNPFFRPILYLDKTYLFRTCRQKLIFGVLQFVFLISLILLYIKNTGSDQAPLYFLIPFLIPLLGALESNSEALSELSHYTSGHLLSAFVADILLWLIVVGIQWVLMSSVFLFFQLGHLADYLLVLALLPLVLILVLTIKFKFLKSRFMRSFYFGLSLFLPMIFPVIFVLLIKDFINDRN